MDEELSDMYYQTTRLRKGKKVIRELQSLTNVKQKYIKPWLSRQALWQVHLPKPKNINRSRYKVTIPNQVHQFYLLYMPGDIFYGRKYKYILSGIDLASRYKIARP